MRRNHILLLLTVPFLFAQTTAPATRPTPAAIAVDNPFYTVWAKSKPGASVTMTPAPGANGAAPPDGQTVVFRLASISDTEITLDVGSTGLDHPEKFTIPRNCPPGEEFLSMMPPEQRKDFALRSHAETPEKITINGKPTDVTVYTIVGDMRPTPTMLIPATYKIYVAPSLTGGFARIDITEGDSNPPTTQTLVATAWQTTDAPASQPAATRPKP